MWCAHCKSEVAAMASSDNERVFCTACGAELSRPAAEAAGGASLPERPPGAPAASSSAHAVRDPRELLARWAREDALEAIDRLPTVSAREPATEARAQRRFDSPHPVLAPVAPQLERAARESPAPAEPSNLPRLPAPVSGRDLIAHAPHGLSAPHFHPAPVGLPDKSSRWVTLVGQICAYVGVAGLTIGAVLVLIGYFGGPGSYAATGWLVTTAGQMLLFLGVITLVSGGMEQTTQEVARRVETLGERLGRIEHAWSAPRNAGPEDAA